MNNIYHFVNGNEFKGTSQRTSDVYNPATGEVTAKVYLASRKDLDDVKWYNIPRYMTYLPRFLMIWGAVMCAGSSAFLA